MLLKARMTVLTYAVLRVTLTPGSIFRLQNDLYCVEWGVKLYSLTRPGSIFTKPTACRASCIFNSASAPSCLAKFFGLPAHAVAVLRSLQAYVSVISHKHSKWMMLQCASVEWRCFAVVGHTQVFRNDTTLLLDLHERVHGRGSKDKPQSILIKPSILRTCFTSFLEPASYITHNSSSPLATYIWTCRFNLLHTATIVHHCFTVSLWAQNVGAYIFRKSNPPP